MARFDVCPIVGLSNLVVIVQVDVLDDLRSRVVVPLLEPKRLVSDERRLCPLLEVDGQVLALATYQLSTVDARSLGNPIANIADERDRIIAALDFLFQGF